MGHGSNWFLETAKETGIEIVAEDNALIWQGETSGNTKQSGPLKGKTVGVLVAA